MKKKFIGVLLAALLALPVSFAFAQVDPITSLYGAYVANPGPSSSAGYVLEMHKLSAAGQNDSHFLWWIGRSYDTAAHQTDWKAFVDETSDAGASTWDLQSRIDAAAYTSRFKVTDAGNVTIPGTLTTTGAQTFTGAATFNGAVTLGDAAADNVTVTGSLASDLIFAEDTARVIRPANQATAATAGDAVTLRGGLGNTTGAGGALNLTGGAGGNDAVGGAVAVAGGAAGGGNRVGGVASVVGGAGAGTAAGAAVDITGGAGGATNTTGGAVNIDGGVDGGTGTGGAVTIDGGVGDTNGNVVLIGTTGKLQIGPTSPMSITNIRIYTLTNVDLDTTDNSIAANVCEDQTVTVTGLVATDNVVVTMTTSDLGVGWIVMAHTPATDALKFRVCNETAGAVDPGAVADFRVVAISGS